jgi:UDP-N-acetylmuramyl pentapeptide synthase
VTPSSKRSRRARARRVILVKGSRFMQMERVAEALAEGSADAA